MRIWFNKTFSTIGSVFKNLRLATRAGTPSVICTHTHSAATAFLAADESYLEPADLAGLDYLDWCVDFCRQQHIGVFWPGKEAALISRHHDRFQAVGTRVLSVADYDTLSLLHNKADFYSALPPSVAQTMAFIAVNDADGFDRAVASLAPHHQRLCVKPAESVFGLGFRVLDTERASITQLLNGVEYQIPLDELRSGMDKTPKFPTLLVMEHLPGVEWSVDCAGKHGELLCAVQRKKLPMAGHGQVIDNNAEIDGMVTRLAAHYRLNGLFNIQFKDGVNGPRLLEINPRPSGGFGMACLAGANLAQMALQAFNGETVVRPVLNYGLRVSEVNTAVVLQDSL